MKKLALLGGEKTIIQEKPHYLWPKITNKTKLSVLGQMDKSISIYDRSGIIEKFESRFAKLHNAKHALLTNSGTSALHSLYVASGLKKDDEVICPAYTFYATVTPLFFTGAIPVLIDCDNNGNINPQKIEEKITSKTKAIMITHMWGVPCQMDEILKIAKKHNLLLFEDFSHAHLAEYKGKYAGSFGDISACSLQGQKTLTGGEGGILLTDNDSFYYKALLFGHYNKRCKNEIPDDYPLKKFAVTGMGLKLRSHPLAVAIADEQLDNLNEVLSNRRMIAKRLSDGLRDLPGIELLKIDDYLKPSWYAFIFKYKSKDFDGLPINDFYKALVAEGCAELDIPNSTCPLNLLPLFQTPKTMFPDYENKVNYKKGDFPCAEEFYSSVLKLPVWSAKEDIKIVDLYIKAIRKVVNNYKELLTE